MQNNKNFGLSDSLITSVKEAMTPNQKKLDKNNNGKLDADDFKKLRGEDAEVDEAQTPQQKAAQAALATQRGEYDAGKKGGAINRMALMKKKALQKIAMGKTKNEEVEIEEGMRLIATHTTGPHSAKVYKDTENDEHRVKFFKNGQHQKNGDYHTDDKEDANSTAKYQLKKWHSTNEEVDLDEVTVGNSAKAFDIKKQAVALKAQIAKLKNTPGDVAHMKMLDAKRSFDKKIAALQELDVDAYEIKKLKEEALDEAKYTYKAATFNGNTVVGTGSTEEDAIKDAKEKAKKMNTTIRKRISMDVTREETEITEADDAVAKQIKAKKEQIKKQIQQKIAQKQMSVMQQKAQKKIQDIKASNDKDAYVNMKKKGKDEIEVSPELREAEDFPSDRNSHGED